MINLKKDKKALISKSLKMLSINLEWNSNKYNNVSSFDIDISALLLDNNSKFKKLIFFNNKKLENESIIYFDDNSNLENKNNKRLFINLETLPSDIKQILIIASIYEPEIENQVFGQIRDSSISIESIALKENTKGINLIKYNLEENFSKQNLVKVAEIYFKDNEWKISAIGQGYKSNLAVL